MDYVQRTGARGSAAAVLGPTGAGTTTAVRIRTTLTRPDGGPGGGGRHRRRPAAAGGATEHATLLAVAWPVVLSVVFAALSVRRFEALSR